MLPFPNPPSTALRCRLQAEEDHLRTLILNKGLPYNFTTRTICLGALFSHPILTMTQDEFHKWKTALHTVYWTGVMQPLLDSLTAPSPSPEGPPYPELAKITLPHLLQQVSQSCRTFLLAAPRPDWLALLETKYDTNNQALAPLCQRIGA